MTQRLANVDLNLLVALDALLTERNVTRAAERMLVGQSAMSSSLGRLRRLFDDPLLVREGRGLVTTPLAESLVGPVRQALELVESMLDVRSSFDPATDHRTFSIQASDYVTFVALRPLLVRIESLAPNVTVHLRPLEGPDFLDQLRRNQCDVLLLPRELLPPKLPYPHTTLFTDRYLVAVDPDNPDVGEHLTVEQFQTQPYLTYRMGQGTALVDDELAAAGIQRNIEVTTESFLLGPTLLRGTRLMMLIHERLARAYSQQLPLRLLEAPMALAPLREVMVWTPEQDRDPGLLWLRDQIRAAADPDTPAPPASS